MYMDMLLCHIGKYYSCLFKHNMDNQHTKREGVLLSFFSPAADLFYFVTFLTVISPIAILFFIPNFFREDTPFFKRRYLLSILTVPLIFLLMFILLFIAWGSSPVIIYSDQKIRVRMIPFIPWPNHPFMD